MKAYSGEKIGGLVLIERVGSSLGQSKTPIWKMECTYCGKKKDIRLSSVKERFKKRGRVSCGCMQFTWLGESYRSHGMYGSSEYKSWTSMKQRCLNSSYDNFKSYGGRGITVCTRWLKFENFFKDMGTKPSPKHTIGRIDNDKGYYPSNCEWQTSKQQQYNQRTTRYFNIEGKLHTTLELRRHLRAINKKLSYYKLNKLIQKNTILTLDQCRECVYE